MSQRLNAHISKKQRSLNRFLKYSTQNGAVSTFSKNIVYSSHIINDKTGEPYGRAVGGWLVGSGPGRGYKTLYFPIPIVALQLLWSVM